MAEEVWKDVPGSAVYQVSSAARWRRAASAGYTAPRATAVISAADGTVYNVRKLARSLFEAPEPPRRKGLTGEVQRYVEAHAPVWAWKVCAAFPEQDQNTIRVILKRLVKSRRIQETCALRYRGQPK